MSKNFYKLTQGNSYSVLPKLKERVNLVLTDPPYGDVLRNAGLGKGGGVAKSIDYGKIRWDYRITGMIFKELQRLSFNQIIFGANHFSHILPQSRGWMVWDKRRMGTSCDFADCELIWTSFDVVPRIFYHRWRGFIRDSEKNIQRVHPTQKPVKLMEWLIENFTKTEDVILDPFLGSGSTMVACQNLGRSCIGVEINPDYCEVVKRRCFGRQFLDREVDYQFEVFNGEAGS